MLYPKEFLQTLDQQRNKVIYARVIALTFDEQPLETIEGKITSGSINLDGASAIRRTCQLSMIAPEDKINISNYYWGLNTKIKLAIGVENQIDNKYPEIIWFEQGIFIITSFNASYNTSNYTINLSGKDKMCLLNGEIAGKLNSSVDFGTIEQEYSKGVWKKIKMPIKDIIREMIHSYAGEPFHNIIINDLDTVGLTLQEYRYKKPMFLLREINTNNYSQGFINDSIQVKWNNKIVKLAELAADNSNFIFENLQEDFMAQTPSEVLYPVNNQNGLQKTYVIAKIDYGETAGYTEGNLVYPDDLIANIGESITSVLDKIKQFLGNFEYFYNTQGQFIFQKQKTYVDSVWSPIVKTEDGTSFVEDLKAADGFAYSFSGNNLFTSFNNTPNLTNLKNDFSVWGTRKSSGTELPIHMRYALDIKPSIYTTIQVKDAELNDYNKINNMNLKGQESKTYIASDNFEDDIDVCYCDWRELIYRMALDYNKYNHLDDFEARVANSNPNVYFDGRTGYEQYYIDMAGFWRQLYNPFEQKNISYTYSQIEILEAEILKEEDQIKKEEMQEQYNWLLNYYDKERLDLFGWARAIYEKPESLLFWFDFMEVQDSDLESFSIPALGARAEVLNDSQVKAIYYRNTPNVIFQSNKTGGGSQTGYRYFNVPTALSMFSKSAQGKSAKKAIDDLLYKHSYCIESVNLVSIPIYYLDTNTRIYVNDVNTGIEGEYIINKISIQLTYNGTMNITAVKAAQRLL